MGKSRTKSEDFCRSGKNFRTKPREQKAGGKTSKRAGMEWGSAFTIGFSENRAHPKPSVHKKTESIRTKAKRGISSTKAQAGDQEPTALRRRRAPLKSSHRYSSSGEGDWETEPWKIGVQL